SRLRRKPADHDSVGNFTCQLENGWATSGDPHRDRSTDGSKIELRLDEAGCFAVESDRCRPLPEAAHEGHAFADGQCGLFLGYSERLEAADTSADTEGDAPACNLVD